MWLDRSKEEKKEYQACSTAFLYEKKKKKRLYAHKRQPESSKVVTGSQCKASGTGCQEEKLMLCTVLN